MKKLFVILSLALVVAPGLMAQGKKAADYDYIPHEGDFAVSVNAVPVFSFIGNMFNGAAGNGVNGFAGQAYLNNDVASPAFGALNPLVSLSVKYLFTDVVGLRLNAGWLYSNFTTNAYSQDDAAVFLDPLSNAKVIDSRKQISSGLSVMVGPEFRAGRGRVQGVFGAGLLYACQTGRQLYTYGNNMSAENQTPSKAFGNAAAPAGFTSARLKDSKNAGCVNYGGLVCFLGVEWFVAPSISLGGEVNVAAVYRWGGSQYSTVEGFNTLTSQVEEWTDLTAPDSSGFQFGTGNIGANLNLTFYF